MQKLLSDFLLTYPNISKTGIYAFVNDKDRKICLFQSDFVLEALTRNLVLLEKGIHNNPELQKDYKQGLLKILFLDDSGDRYKRKIKLISLRSDYESKGFSCYNRNSYLKYKVCMDFTDQKSPIGYKILVYLKLHQTTIPVGVFEKIKEADKFIDKYYKEFDTITIADNYLTNVYLNWYRTNTREIYKAR